jgi:gluconokinase
MISAMTGAPLLVVLGPSGNGKTTLGTRLGEVLGVPFEDADDLHPHANVEKMTAGIPLTDADRAPWLATVHQHLAAHVGTGLVMACSALKRRYRDTLREGLPQLGLIYPEVSPAALTERVARRQHHYMPATLVQSQLAAWEPLGPDENSLTVDGEGTPDASVAAVQAWMATLRN